MAGRIHVVGAGLAGLSASLRLAEAGKRVVLHEAARHAGGRCRSYYDTALDCRIDNGNHLLIAGNSSAMDYLKAIGATDTLSGPEEPRYDFLDMGTGERWVMRPNPGRLPWWIFSSNRRIPGTGPLDYLKGAALRHAGPQEVVTDQLQKGTTIFRRLWEPLAVAALNTETDIGSAQLLWRVLSESFGQGGMACRPLIPNEGLSESLVEPALRRLQELGAEQRFGSRLREIELEGDRVSLLRFDEGDEKLEEGDQLVLAVPPAVASRLLPEIEAPDEYRAILNAHFRAEGPAGSPPFVGVIGGTAEWVFKKPQVLSVTVSAADRLIDRPAAELAEILWRDVTVAYGMPASPLPAWQIVKEKRATFAALPSQVAKRPQAATRWRNLALAGDWTDTGLPATIEGAIRSGVTAARVTLAAEVSSGQRHRSAEASPPAARMVPSFS